MRRSATARRTRSSTPWRRSNASRMDEASGHGHEDLVAEVVASGVVHRLELVEVDEKEAGPPARRERGFELMVQQRPVCEPGQAVVERLMAQPILELDPLAHVTERY